MLIPNILWISAPPDTRTGERLQTNPRCRRTERKTTLGFALGHNPLRLEGLIGVS